MESQLHSQSSHIFVWGYRYTSSVTRHESICICDSICLWICDSICLWLDMGWLRLVGSLKIYVSFAKEPYKRDFILQNTPIICRSLLIVATPSDISMWSWLDMSQYVWLDLTVTRYDIWMSHTHDMTYEWVTHSHMTVTPYNISICYIENTGLFCRALL